MEACKHFCVPTRIRTDHETENLAVARAMLEIKGAETNPVFTGQSVHNQKIERCWILVLSSLFYHLESRCNLDLLNELHLFPLHFVFLARINRILAEIVTAWNQPPTQTS